MLKRQKGMLGEDSCVAILTLSSTRSEDVGDETGEADGVELDWQGKKVSRANGGVGTIDERGEWVWAAILVKARRTRTAITLNLNKLVFMLRTVAVFGSRRLFQTINLLPML